MYPIREGSANAIFVHFTRTNFLSVYLRSGTVLVG